jgi:hypothetical protein
LQSLPQVLSIVALFCNNVPDLLEHLINLLWCTVLP